MTLQNLLENEFGGDMQSLRESIEEEVGFIIEDETKDHRRGSTFHCTVLATHKESGLGVCLQYIWDDEGMSDPDFSIQEVLIEKKEKTITEISFIPKGDKLYG